MNSQTDPQQLPDPEHVPGTTARRKTLLRWAVPVGVMATILAAGGISSLLPANAGESLPPRDAQQLLLDVQNAQQTALSGTVVQRTNMGLPQLPSSGSADLTSLASGSHTMRLWYAGPQKVRVALLGTLGESDVIRNDRDFWIWSSQERTVTHSVLPERKALLERGEKIRKAQEKRLGAPLPTPSALTPQAAAAAVLQAVEPTTVVRTDGPVKVAGEKAYELVLSPKNSDSLIGQVRIAIEAVHHVPVRLQVFPGSGKSPAFEIAFTQISFDRPADSHFRFTAPSGAKLRELASAPSSQSTMEPVILGKAWTTVLAGRISDNTVQKMLGTGPLAKGDQDYSRSDSSGLFSGNGRGMLDQLLQSFKPVSGSWGKGRIISAGICSILVTEDGRFYAGAVRPEVLFRSAAKPLPTAESAR